ncbi:LysR family transcriptional regulator [Gordonibacter sp. An230]|uniref:helix-turn-helix domain-containing protein n=1 Tax=Gordonibacter sp. An230 TaxID=1965592 RepID=UPI000B39E278|nr:LysR family transcriptional regulator [Gordonibacter sp. An230]OUO87607.1 LysR family transcriptional regulator [Gordonibacter sp. An230]
METAHLAEFARVADFGSFTAAARELHLTQSTLSKHIALLEREFGVDLFVRDRNGVSLTEAGGVLYAQAWQIKRLLRATEALVRAAGEGHAGAPCGAAGAGMGAAAARGAAGAQGSRAAMRGAAGGAAGMSGGLARGAARATDAGDTALRCKCRLVAERRGLDGRELGALILYVEERGFEAIEAELGLSRDEVADVLACVYRKLGVEDKQGVLDLIHSVSE